MIKQASLTIDTIQNGKKQFIDKYIDNPVLNKAWHNFVAKQTAFCQAALETQLEMVSEVSKTLMDTKVRKLVNPFNIDWFDAGWEALVQQNIAETNKEKKNA